MSKFEQYLEAASAKATDKQKEIVADELRDWDADDLVEAIMDNMSEKDITAWAQDLDYSKADDATDVIYNYLLNDVEHEELVDMYIDKLTDAKIIAWVKEMGEEDE